MACLESVLVPGLEEGGTSLDVIVFELDCFNCGVLLLVNHFSTIGILAAASSNDFLCRSYLTLLSLLGVVELF